MTEHNRLPLSSSTREATADAKGSTNANPGLQFARFFGGYKSNFDAIDESAKRDFIGKLANTANSATHRDAIDQYRDRQIRLVNELGGICRVFRTDWHFVTGMGMPSPLENGFSWHWTLGTPYIPGSTVKGLTRAWAELHTDFDDSQLARWFGHARGSTGTESAGNVIFFDAIPTRPPAVACDVMTPHMGNWYQQGGSTRKDSTVAPGDWHAPIPVPFLVTKDASFLFSVAARPGCEESIEPVITMLTDALEWLGVGSKTAVGYGHMSVDEAGTAEIEHAQRDEYEQQLVSLQLQLDREMQNTPDPNDTEFKIALRQLFNSGSLQEWPIARLEKLLALAATGLKFHNIDNWKKKTKKGKPSLYMRLQALVETRGSD